MDAPLLYSDKLPLRRAAELPQYRAEDADRVLPWVFGRATISPVPLDLTGAEWLVADHPIAGIDRVTLAGLPTDGWQLVQRLDATGRPVSVLRLAQPTTTQAVAVTVAGRRHPDTGELLTKPAAIVRELMRVCGHAEPRDAWAGLDEHFGQVALGIAFAEGAVTLREAVAAVVEPLGAMWRPGWAARRAPGQPAATLDASVVESITARAENTTLCTSARVTHAHDWAAGAARASMHLAAPQAVAAWGDLPMQIDLPAVTAARDALAIASARLADAARVRWDLAADVSDRVGDLREGMTVLVAHPHAPAGLAVLTAVSLDREAGQYAIKAEMYTATAPRVEMVRRGAALVPSASTAPPLAYRDGVATFTILDDLGEPIAHASVTLDGQATATTNSIGQVQFRTTRGTHTLTVTAAGMASFKLDVFV